GLRAWGCHVQRLAPRSSCARQTGRSVVAAAETGRPGGYHRILAWGTSTSTRTAAARFGICVAALVFVVLIVFMLQNTGRVEVNFLGWQGTAPLALTLLIAAVGA